jgi:hypothetical protein
MPLHGTRSAAVLFSTDDVAFWAHKPTEKESGDSIVRERPVHMKFDFNGLKDLLQLPTIWFVSLQVSTSSRF